MSLDLVLEIFIKTRVMAKDVELYPATREAAALVAYKSTGR